MKVLRSLFIIVGILTIFLVGVVGLSSYGYSKLQTEFEGSTFGVKTDLNATTFFTALLSAITQDWIGAASSIIQGLDIQGELVFSNSTFVPLYIPEMEHSISLNGLSTATTSKTPSFWLAPGAEIAQYVSVLIPTQDIPEAVLTLIANHGNIDVEVASQVFLGPISWTKTSASSQQLSIGQGNGTVPQHSSPLVNGTWSLGSTNITSASKNSQISANISLSSGTAGSYTFQVKRDIALSADQIVESVVFEYNGEHATKTLSFIPSYATGEAGTDGYHMDLLHNGVIIWTMADSYPPRLRVTTAGPPSTTAVSPVTMINYQFNPASVGVGSTTTFSLNFSGGNNGTYTINFIKDIPLGSDQLISQHSIQHNGNSSSISVSFIPTSAGSYHVDMTYGGRTVWSQPNDSTRLLVAASSSPLTVSQYVFNPVTITLGNSCELIFALEGGSAGQYTLRFIKDVSFLPDQEISQYTFQYNGSATSITLSFTPPSKGTYHVDLSFEGAKIWSQPNDSSRLKVG